MQSREPVCHILIRLHLIHDEGRSRTKGRETEREEKREGREKTTPYMVAWAICLVGLGYLAAVS